MIFKEYPDREALAMDLADALASDLETALRHNDRVSFAVPGGTSPGPVFDSLSGVGSIDWARVDVLLTDERWVPQDHARSNTALLRKRLLVDHAQAAVLSPMYKDGAIESAVPELGAHIAPMLPLSVVLLGMGADMHTASLFPGAPGVGKAMAADAPVLNIVEPADQPDRRVSLSASVLNGALAKHLLIMGDDKRIALEQAQSMRPEEAPIAAVLSGMTVHWAE